MNIPEKHFNWFTAIAIILFFLLLACAPIALHCEENWKPANAFAVGTVFLALPLLTADKNLGVGHQWEITGFSYAATDIGYRFMPKGFARDITPLIVGLLDFSYRATELGNGNDGLVWKKFFTNDLLGIAGRVTITF